MLGEEDAALATTDPYRGVSKANDVNTHPPDVLAAIYSLHFFPPIHDIIKYVSHGPGSIIISSLCVDHYNIYKYFIIIMYGR